MLMVQHSSVSMVETEDCSPPPGMERNIENFKPINVICRKDSNFFSFFKRQTNEGILRGPLLWTVDVVCQVISGTGALKLQSYRVTSVPCLALWE